VNFSFFVVKKNSFTTDFTDGTDNTKHAGVEFRSIDMRIVGEQIRIRAVLDCRRAPKWIHARLQK